MPVCLVDLQQVVGTAECRGHSSPHGGREACGGHRAPRR